MAEAKPFNQCLLLILIGLMILTGSINTIFNKILQKLYGKDIIFEQHHWIITFGMFLGELVSIFFYIYVVIKRNKKEGEKLVENKPDEEAGETPPPEDENEGEKKPPIPTNFFFCITALCDLTATTINTFGLTYLTTSMFQMMRGLELFFVCLWSKIFLKNHIYRHQILGVGTLIFGLSLVGLNSILNDKDSDVAKNPVVGIILLSTSQLFTSTEYIIQEKFIKHYDVHPFQLVGFEGLWGSIMYGILLVIFQIVSCDDWSDALKEGICFTNDEGESYIEDTRFAFEQMWDNKNLLVVYIFYVVSIALYNIVGINLTKLVSSTARAVVDTVRTVFIWAFFLFFTPVDGTKEDFHVLQFIGFIFLVCGTLVYNEIVTLPFWNLDYYTRVNIAKRKKENNGGENEAEKDKLYDSSKQSIGSNTNENPEN
jgi:drug/metabolite transporter (DMT)-like permease